MKECDLCWQQNLYCKEYPFKTRVMRRESELAPIEVVGIFPSSPIEECKVREETIRLLREVV